MPFSTEHEITSFANESCLSFNTLDGKSNASSNVVEMSKHLVQYGNFMLIDAEQSDDKTSKYLQLSYGILPSILLFFNLKLSDFGKSEIN